MQSLWCLFPQQEVTTLEQLLPLSTLQPQTPHCLAPATSSCLLEWLQQEDMKMSCLLITSCPRLHGRWNWTGQNGFQQPRTEETLGTFQTNPKGLSLPEAAPGFLQKTQIVFWFSATSFWKDFRYTRFSLSFSIDLTCNLVFPVTLFLFLMPLANFIQNWCACIWAVTGPRYVDSLFPIFEHSKHFKTSCDSPGSILN